MIFLYISIVFDRVVHEFLKFFQHLPNSCPDCYGIIKSERPLEKELFHGSKNSRSVVQ